MSYDTGQPGAKGFLEVICKILRKTPVLESISYNILKKTLTIFCLVLSFYLKVV